MLHGVVQPKDTLVEPAWRRHTQAEVDLILGSYSQRYKFISLTEAVGMINGSLPWKKYCMVVTIDDGYRNCLDVAYPIFKKYNIPMTVFSTVNNILNQQPFWVDKLEYVFQNSVDKSFCLNLDKFNFKTERLDKLNIKSHFNDFLKKVKLIYSNDYEMLHDIDNYFVVTTSNMPTPSYGYLDFFSDPCFSILSVDQLSSLPDDITVGSHMMNHVRCTHISPCELTKELSESRAWLESHTGKPCLHFCYPNGDYDASIASAVCGSGYTSSVTTLERCNKKGDDVYALHRFPFPYAASVHEANYRLTHCLLNQS